MDLFALPPVATLLDAAYRALMGLTHLLEPLTGGLAAVLAVVLVTLLVRAALIPVGVSQAKAERTRARMAPLLAEVQRRHAHDPAKLQAATMQLYADQGASPFAGCLPVLAQAPVIGVIYAVFVHPQLAGHGNDLLTATLGGVPLGTSLMHAITGGGVSGTTVVVFGLLVAAIALAGELSRRAVAPGGALAIGTPASAPAGVGRLLGAMQFVTAVMACVVPLAAGVYLLVTVWWTLGQRLVLRRRYPLG